MRNSKGKLDVKPSLKGILNLKEGDTLNNSSSSISAFTNNLRIMSGNGA
jgi:hypothetical protein